MRAHHALRVSLPGAPAGTGWRRLFTIAILTALAVVGPTAAAYATDTVVSERPVTSVSDQGLLVRANASSDRLYPGASQNVSLFVTNRGAQDVTTIAVRHVDIIVTGAVGKCGSSDFTMQTTTALVTLIPAGTTRKLDLPGAITMKRSADDGCQGATLQLVVTVDAS